MMNKRKAPVDRESKRFMTSAAGRMLVCLLLATAAAASAGVVKQSLTEAAPGQNLLRGDRWRAWQQGFERQGDALWCNNGADGKVQRGASQTITLNQQAPAPIVAEAWSKAEGVGGSRDGDYSIYLDLVYADGSELWGQTASFNAGSHDWEKRRVVVLPAKPVKSLSMNLLLRRHTGQAWFRDARLWEVKSAPGAAAFDGMPVSVVQPPQEGFLVRDVAAGGDFRDDFAPLGLKLATNLNAKPDEAWVEAEVTDATGKDRAITLVYTAPAPEGAWDWLADPRTRIPATGAREYLAASRFGAGANGHLSTYPFAAIACGEQGRMLGIDLREPAFFRVAYSAPTRELYLAFDLGLTKERPTARVRLLRASFDGRQGFRGALQRYYDLLPDCFRSRTPRQGAWMPFHAISKVEGWQDFGFQFKEGNDETAWDDAHGITTFRYTEPMTWWMSMKTPQPHTIEQAVAEAQRLAREGNPQARALLTSGYHDEQGRFVAKLLDTPWCNGAVWSMNSMPGIKGEVTDWSLKWGPAVREKFYGPKAKGRLDGEYIDSSEGYVTDELDFRRDHFAAAALPLTFAADTFKPAIFRGLIIAEYARQMARDVHAMDRLMMANSTPARLCWLAPWLDVMGTETDWHRGGQWRPMADAELLYRRALCGPKPYCFLMNTDFKSWSAELTEKFMQRCLAYGMFPGFFSANAATGHYFSQPALYNRDRPLFKKYLPLCRRVAEAGWQPLTRARSSEERVYVERFGEHLLTVFNDSAQERRAVRVTLEGLQARSARELLSGRSLELKDGSFELTLGPEAVAVVELP